MKRVSLWLGVVLVAILSLCGWAAGQVVGGSGGVLEPTRVVGSFPASHYGGMLEDAAWRDVTNTALFCTADHPDGTAKMNCGNSPARHRVVGAGTFSAANYFTTTSTLNTAFVQTALRGCVVYTPTSTAADYMLLAPYVAPRGWLVYQGAGGFVYAQSFGSTAASLGTVVVNTTNVVCFGVIHGTAGDSTFISLNGENTQTGAGAFNALNAGETVYVARYAGADALLGSIGEIWMDATTPTAANVKALGDAVLAAKNQGALLSSTGATAHWVGDDFNNGNWTARAGTALTKVGQPLYWAGLRYNWPSVAFASNGTVPRVSQSGLYDRGFGVQHRASGVFSDANYWSLGAGADVADITTGTFCAIINPTVVGANTFASDGPATGAGVNGGWSAGLNASSQFLLTFGAASTRASTRAVVAGRDSVACWGFDGTNSYVVLDTDTVSSGAGTTTAATTTALMLGRAAAAGVPWNGLIREFYATTTAASATLLGKLRDQALNCVKPGACFVADANAVLHVAMDRDLQGTGATAALYSTVNTGVDTWTRNGSITSSSSVLTFPYSVEGRDMLGAGPTSVANYQTSTNTANPLYWANGSNWTMYALFDAPLTTTKFISADGYYYGGAFVDGWALWRSSDILFSTASGGGVTRNSVTCGTATTTGPNFASWGLNAGTAYCKLNAATVVTSAAVPYAVNTGIPVTIGGGGPNYNIDDSPIYAVWATTTAPTTARLDALHAAVLNQTGSMQYPTISTTRTTEATYEADGRLYRAPPGVSRVSPFSAFTNSESGRLGEGQYIQTARYDEQLDNLAVWVPTNTTVTANQGVAPDGQTTLELVNTTVAGAGNHNLQAVTTANSATFTASSWFRASAGTQTGTVGLFCPGVGTASGCTCWRADGGTCTAALGAGNTSCFAYGAFSTTYPVRVSASATCSAAGTDPDIFVAGGQYETSTGSVLAGLVQMEVGLYPHNYCGVTTNATRTCNADQVTAPNPLRGLGADWTNAVLQSEMLTTTWAAVGNVIAAPTVTANQGMAIDGSLSAESLVLPAFTAGVGERSYITQTPTLVNGDNTFSIWLRGAAGGEVVYVFGTPDDVNFTKTTATLTTSWQRFSVTRARAGTNIAFRVGYDARDATQAAQSGGTIYAWGAQVEQASTASNYCGPTLTAALTCGPGGAVGKVVTNAALNSETAGSWTLFGLTGVTADATAGPGAPAYAALVKEDGNNSEHYIAQNFTATAAAWTVSLYAKQKERTWIAVSPDGGTNKAWYNLATCAVGTVAAGSTAAAGAVANGYCRLRHSRTLGAGANSFRVYLASADNVTIYAGDGTSGLYVAGMQAELGSAAEPYCGPTLGTTKRCAPSQRWCVKTRVTPENGRAWAKAAALWSVGTSAAANSAALTEDGAGNLVLTVVDGYAASGTATWAHGYAAGSTHSVIGCGADGVLSLWSDGVQQAATLGGTGRATMTTIPTTAYIGQSSAGAQLDGYQDGPYFCRDSDPAKCGFLNSP